MKLTLDPGAAALLNALHAAGYAAYAVGGCVRDSLLGRTAHDWDLCTSALPQQVMELFGAERCIPTGLQHGTVTIKYGGQLYETTTFRTEGSYTDGRHPDAVQFVPDVREDLARRDFTINAMAYNEAEGLVDPFGGQKDLQNGLLRAVGEPQQRFTEDALRILRLYRFAARFGFALDAATARAARQLAPHLDCISAERIQEELAKLLAAPQPGVYLEPAVLAVVLLFTFVIRLIGVDGHSMVPTLQDGDRLLVLNAMLDNDYEYGDIVVLRKDTFLEEPIVKRVIATEGQTVDIDFVSGAVYVDGELLEEDYINEPTYVEEGTEFPLTVPEGSIFVMGDNRNHSSDSRSSDLGTVDTRYVIGKAVFLLFPGADEATGQRDFGRIGPIAGID